MNRHRDARYWVHSDPIDTEPEPETIDQSIARIATEIEAACPGECNKQWRRDVRRALRELDRANTSGDTPDPRIVHGPLTPRTGTPVWCLPCTEDIIRALSRLPDLAAACGRRRDGQLAPPPPSDRHAAAVAPRSPSPAFDQVDTIVAFAAEWADQLARHMHDHDPALYRADGFRAPTLTRTVMFLIHRRTALFAAPFAGDFGKATLSLARRAETVGGVDDLVHELAEPCFVCHLRALSRRDGADRVVCAGCRRSWSWEQFQWLARHIIREKRDSRARRAAH